MRRRGGSRRGALTAEELKKITEEYAAAEDEKTAALLDAEKWRLISTEGPAESEGRCGEGRRGEKN